MAPLSMYIHMYIYICISFQFPSREARIDQVMHDRSGWGGSAQIGNGSGRPGGLKGLTLLTPPGLLATLRCYRVG